MLKRTSSADSGPLRLRNHCRQLTGRMVPYVCLRIVSGWNSIRCHSGTRFGKTVVACLLVPWTKWIWTHDGVVVLFYSPIPYLPNFINYLMGRSKWPHGLRRRCASARVLGLRVRIPPKVMVVCLVWLLCVVTYKSLRWADHSYGGVLPSVVCLSVVVRPRKGGHDTKSVRSATGKQII